MAKSTKKSDASIFDDEPTAEDAQAETDAKQAAADAAASKAAEEAKATAAQVTQGNGPELIALRTIKGLGGKDKVIYPNQGSRSLFRCLDGKERKRLIDIGAAMEQDANDDSRIIVPR